MKKFFTSALISLLTCLIEISYLSFWTAAFIVALTWPSALATARTSEPAAGFAAVFAYVAAIVVPLFSGTVFWLVRMMVKRKNGP